MSRSLDTCFRTHADSRGSILISLLLVMCLTVLTFSSTIVSSVEWSLANNSLRQAQALALAESGIEHAMMKITEADGDLGGLLAGKDGKPGTDDDGLVIGSSAIVVGDDGGAYSVVLIDNDDGDGDTSVDADDRYHLLSTGTIRGATQTVRVVLELGAGGVWSPRYGILTNDKLTLDSGVELIGAASTAFSNRDVKIYSMRVDGGAWAKGKFDIRSKRPLIEGNILDKKAVDRYEKAHDHQAPEEIPPIDPADYAKYAEYTLSRDGKIYRPDGTVEFDTVGGTNAWGNWHYEGKSNWTLDGPANGDEGAFYVEGSVTVTGSGGTVGDPIELSLFAEGSVEFAGNFQIESRFGGLLAVARGDVYISGASTYRGSLLVHEQLKMRGASTLHGVILVENADDHFKLLRRSKKGTHLTEDTTIWPDAETKLTRAGGGGLVAVEWREEY